eukprot:6573303-Prorocentrum_lima.AAC.1
MMADRMDIFRASASAHGASTVVFFGDVMQDFKNHWSRWTRAPWVSQEGPASWRLARQDRADPT